MSSCCRRQPQEAPACSCWVPGQEGGPGQQSWGTRGQQARPTVQRSICKEDVDKNGWPSLSPSQRAVITGLEKSYGEDNDRLVLPS